ncbi:MAG TPA: hypothetical protein VGB45_02645 [Abditibacterium sp.]|jgi:hypothetical protein
MRRFIFCFLLLLCAGAQSAPQFLDDEAEPLCDVAFSLHKGSAGQFELLFDHQDAKNGYVLTATPSNTSFSVVKNGVKRALSSAPIVWKAQNTVVLQRRPWLMRLLVDGRVVLTAFDASFNDGKIGANLASGWNWKDVRVQPVEPIRFDDDFTRAGREGDNSWQTASGKWELSASSAQVNARNANMSSNPFAFEASAPKMLALATTGRKFWDSYDARVAARPSSAGSIGIAVYVQDPKNYLAFVWDGNENSLSRRIVRVKDGVSTTIASASGAFLPRQWYEIGLRTSPGYVEALIDGAPVLRARDDSFGQGGIGLLAQNLEIAAFDDVRVRSYDFYRQNLAASNGAWTTNGAFRLTGRGDWNNYRLIAPIKSEASGVFGLVAGFRDSKNYTLFRAASTTSTAAFRGRQQIVRFQDGVAKILSDAPFSAIFKLNPRLTLSAQNGALSIAAGDEILAQSAQSGLTTGQTGVWNPAAFGSDTVLYFPPAPEPPKIAARMEDDAYMVGWASATGEWPPAAGENGLEFWNTGEFFGDASLEFPWRASYKGHIEIALRAARGKFASGAVLRGQSSDDLKSVKWTLSRDGKTLGGAQVAIPAAESAESPEALSFKIALQGPSVLLFAGDAPILSVLDTAAPAGNSLAVRSQGFRVRAERLRAQNTNRDDTAFSRAPTDFYAPQGNWSIFSRWPCYGDWSFFGGEGLSPVLWSKRTYGGDIVAEMYAHPQMILPKEPGYSHPGDLNVTLCGDGKNPSSGYNFVVAGWDNTRTKLLRGNQVLAEVSGPGAFFPNSINHNERWHRKWFYIRAEARRATVNGKNGVQLTLTLDDNPILTAFDPSPLPNWEKGGRVAFWTLDSTLMIARAKIEAHKMGLKSLPVGLLDTIPRPNVNAKAPQPVVLSDAATALVSPAKEGWKIQNPVSGGHFEVRLGDKPVEATPQTRLEIDASIPAGVHIDAYVLIDGALHTLEMTGNQKPDAMAPPLGQMTRAGTKWNFDVGAALQKQFPNQKTWKIEALTLGAKQGDVYRWAGFNGNSLGASYELRGWDWLGS